MFFPRSALGLFIVLTIAAAAVPASPPLEYTAREWHESDGMPTEEIDSLAVDSAGYLWIAGAGKFARFDGSVFDAAKTPLEVDLRGMVARAGREEAKGSFLIAPPAVVEGAENAGGKSLAGYALFAAGRFLFQHEMALDGKAVKMVFPAPDGALWLGCEDGTLLRKDSTGSRVFPAAPGVAKKKPPALVTDGNGDVWSLIGEEVARFDGERWTPVPVILPATALRLVSSRSGGPWLITQDTVLKWTGDTLQPVARLAETTGAHFVQTAIEDRHGTLWFGTRSQGLHRVVADRSIRMEVSHSDIAALQEDADGNIWVGTNGGGLVRLKTKTFWLYDKSSGLSDDFSHSVAADASGSIWLANRDGGVARIRDGVVDPVSKRAAWRAFSAKSVFPAPDGSVWIATGIGVYRSRANNPDAVDRIHPLAYARTVRVTFVARNGDYWFALDPDKVVRWRDGEITTFGAAEGFDGREIRVIAEDSAGTIWLGAAEGRLFRSRENGFERVPLPPRDDYGLLQAIWFEPDGTLLIGTTRKGVLILPPTDSGKPVRLLSTKQGLPNGDVTNILRDDAGRYWFAARGGIFSVRDVQIRDFASGKVDRVHAVLLGKDHGLPQLSVLGRTQPSACKAVDGTLWFATRKGVVRVDPSLAPEIASPAPAMVAQISADGEVQLNTRELQIESTVRKIEVRFSVLSLSIPEQTVVRHRLDGFDNDWVLAGNGRVATYPRLPPGTYTLRAEVSDGAETWSEQPPLLTLHVVPAWWQTGWAQAACFCLLVLGITVSVRVWSYRRLRQRLRQAEQDKELERERMRIARNIHDDLGASLTRIGLITESTAHKNPILAVELEQIAETVRGSTRSLDEIVWAVNPKWDDVENLASYLGNYAQKFLSTAGIRRRLNIPAFVPSMKLPSQTRHSLFLCCKEALNNVVKHAAAKEVSLTVAVDELALEIEIADDGRGLAGAGAVKSDDTARIATGNGLQNMRDRMDEIGGDFSISDRPGGGTIVVFRLRFPLKTRIEKQPAGAAAGLLASE